MKKDKVLLAEDKKKEYINML